MRTVWKLFCYGGVYVRLTQFKVKEFKRILRDNGYKEVRCCGSHQTWSNGTSKITLPTVKLSPVIAARLIKENNLMTAKARNPPLL